MIAFERPMTAAEILTVDCSTNMVTTADKFPILGRKKFLSVKLCYAGFEHSDWLEK